MLVKTRQLLKIEFYKNTQHYRLGHPIILIEIKTNSKLIIFQFQAAFQFTQYLLVLDILIAIAVKY